jgi:hypothetical protein
LQSDLLKPDSKEMLISSLLKWTPILSSKV